MIDTPQKNEKGYYILDHSLRTSEERAELVDYIIKNTDSKKLTKRYTQILTDYILIVNSLDGQILTPNRMITINKREISIESLINSFESDNCGGAEKVYGLLNRKPDKNQRLTQKFSITEEDIKTVPGLKQLRDAIEKAELQLSQLKGTRKYKMKQAIIDMRKDQYVLKNSAKPIMNTPLTHTYTTQEEVTINEYENIKVDSQGNIITNSPYTFFNEKYVSALCHNYDILVQWADAHCGDNIYYSYKQLRYLLEKHLKIKNPMLYDLFLLKVLKKTNREIKEILSKKYKISYSFEYYSILWQRKIPSLIVKYAEEDFLDWYFTYKEKGDWKKCHKCGQNKLRMSRFFSRNKASSDGFYSVCKECRTKKYQEKKKKEDLKNV